MSDATCKIPGCDTPVKVHVRGLCGFHYGRARRAGELDVTPREVEHVLTEVDEEARTAICAICGPTEIKLSAQRFNALCLTNIRARGREYAKASRAKGGKRKTRENWMRYKYGIDHDEYDRMFAEQAGACAICGDAVKLVVDHHHGTGAVRGLLCLPCNWGIGQLKDNPDVVARAVTYLRDWSAPVSTDTARPQKAG